MNSFTLLDSIQENVVGKQSGRKFTKQAIIFIRAEGESVGASIKIQADSPVGDWHDLHITTLAESGLFDPIFIEGPLSGIRAVVEDYEAGTITVSGYSE